MRIPGRPLMVVFALGLSACASRGPGFDPATDTTASRVKASSVQPAYRVECGAAFDCMSRASAICGGLYRVIGPPLSPSVDAGEATPATPRLPYRMVVACD